MATSKLREWRLANGLTVADIAGLGGCSESYMSRVERGERNLAPAAKVALARRLRVPVRELFEVEPLGLVDAR